MAPLMHILLQFDRVNRIRCYYHIAVGCVLRNQNQRCLVKSAAVLLHSIAVINAALRFVIYNDLIFMEYDIAVFDIKLKGLSQLS